REVTQDIDRRRPEGARRHEHRGGHLHTRVTRNVKVTSYPLDDQEAKRLSRWRHVLRSSPERLRVSRSGSGGAPPPRQRVPDVGSDRGAVPPSLAVGFPGPSPEPDVRLPPHPALPEPVPCGYAASVVSPFHGVGMAAPR